MGITWPDAFYAQYDYDLTNAIIAIRENGASSGAGVLGAYAYDDLGRRILVERAGGAGAETAYSYDGASRLASLTQDLSGASADVTLGMSYNLLSPVVQATLWRAQGQRRFDHR